MKISEVCVYQVNPKKVELFEETLAEMIEMQKKQPGLLDIRCIKRDHRIDYEQINKSLPPKKITKIVKSVKYLIYWEFDCEVSLGNAISNVMLKFDKQVNKCLIIPHDKYIGTRIY